MTPLLAKFCRGPDTEVIQTFPPELSNRRSSIGAFIAAILLFPINLFFRKVIF